MINFKQTCLIIMVWTVPIVFQGCQSGADYQTERQKVMDLHDKVMGDSEEAVNNKMLLDTILLFKMPALLAADPGLDTLKEKQKVANMISKLNDADEIMMDWMNEFEPDVDGKSSDEALKYFKDEFAKIKSLDQQFKEAITQSDHYISKIGIEKANNEKAHDEPKY